MKAMAIFAWAMLLIVTSEPARAQDLPQWKDLFNGKDLAGWVNVNTDADTWSVQDGVIKCTGRPIGVLRAEKQRENFIVHLEWRHMTPGGNSGLFVWSDAVADRDARRLPNGVEVQILEVDWVNQNKTNGQPAPIAYVHGEVFGCGVELTPDNPRGKRSKSIENRCKGTPEWNAYDVVCIDGTVKLAVNGVFVNGVSKAEKKKGYICLESEGKPIEFRNIKIMELAPGVTGEQQSWPEIKE